MTALSVTNPNPPIPEFPKSSPLFGNMREFTHDALEFILAARQYGDLVRFTFGPFSAHLVNDPDLAHEVLVTNAKSYFKSSVTKRVLYQAVGEGLFTNDGDSWKRQRKLSQPAFHTKRIANYADVMVDYTQKRLETWRDDSVIDVEREMAFVTMQIVAKTLFDAYITGDEDDLSQAVKTILRTVDKRFNNLIPVPDWLPTPQNLKMAGAVRTLDRIIQQFIDERRKTNEDKGDLLSMLMAAMDEDNSSGMSDKQLRDEAMTVFGAGHETSSGALTWTWYLLSQYPEAEAKLHAELAAVLGGRAPTFNDLPNLPYADMVIKEAMRLYPPAWTVSRESLEEVKIGAYRLPKRSILLINIYGMHRSATYWEQPDTFIPERFSAENEKTHHKHAYLPFGAGPRVCIGNAFAMMEMRLILATIAQRFSLRLVPSQAVKPERVFTLRSKYGMKMIAHERKTRAEG